MNLETFERAAAIYDHRNTVAHEAAHAAAALAQDLVVRNVSAVPDEVSAGRALIDRPADPDGLRKYSISILAGRLEVGHHLWPPSWPLPLAPDNDDEAVVVGLVKKLGLDRAGYARLVQDTIAVTTSREYERLHAGVSHLLTRDGHVDQSALEHVRRITKGADMQHAIKSATVVTADQGAFAAIAATYSVDRVRDRIVPDAFANTIRSWQKSGKRVPLHWDHKGEAANVIGWIDPNTMRETGEGLQIVGKLDIADSDIAREAWRSMRNGTMSLSFGYIATKSRKRNDGINELHELDLFEISIVPHPANPDTRIIEMKHVPDDDSDLGRFREEWKNVIVAYMGAGGEPETLRQKSERIAREFAPVTVAEFPC